MNVSRTTPNEPEPRLRRSEHVKRLLLGGLLTATTLAGGLAFTSEVSAADDVEPTVCVVPEEADALVEEQTFEESPDECPEHKVWVCKYSGTPGVDEKFKPGKNPIEVDSSATAGTYFNDAQGRSFVLGAFDESPGIEKCPGREGPSDEVTETVPVCGTTTVTVTTITYTGDKEGWFPNAPVKSTRSLTDKEKASLNASCTKAAEVTFSDWKGEPACAATTVAQTRSKTTIGYTYNADTGLFVAGAPATAADNRTLILAPAEIKPCPTTPAVQVASQSPVAPAAAPPAAVAPAAVVSAVPTQLPATGTSSWVMALVALAALAGGTGLVRLSRRSTD